MNFKEKIKELIDSALSENQHLFLVDFTVGADYTVKVILDGDYGVSIDDCVQISRAIEHNLDREQEDFSIEVTSCGIFSPLVLQRQYIKNIGREIQIKTEEGIWQGELISVDNNQITLKSQTREPKPIGKGKITVIKENVFVIEKIKEAKLVIKF